MPIGKLFKISNLIILIDVGSSGLHVVNGAFHTGMKANGWKFEKVLKAMWKLFNNFPARINLYIQMKHFRCFSIDVLPDKLAWGWTCYHPNNGSLQKCCECHKAFPSLMRIKTTKQKQFIRYPGQPHAGMFMKVKLQLFADGANMISLYLKQFQTDNPMI